MASVFTEASATLGIFALKEEKMIDRVEWSGVDWTFC